MKGVFHFCICVQLCIHTLTSDVDYTRAQTILNKFSVVVVPHHNKRNNFVLTLIVKLTNLTPLSGVTGPPDSCTLMTIGCAG